MTPPDAMTVVCVFQALELPIEDKQIHSFSIFMKED